MRHYFFNNLNFFNTAKLLQSLTILAILIVSVSASAANLIVNVFEEFDDNDEVRMEKFLQTTQPEFAVLKGTVQSREMFGNIRRIPTLLVFDREGNLAFDFVHAQGATKQSVDSEELLGAIRPLL